MFDSVENFRDFISPDKGSKASHAKGRLFRSGHLGNCSSADLLGLRNLGIGTVIDLRSHAERLAFPNPLENVVYVVGDEDANHGDWDALASLTSGEPLIPSLFKEYNKAFYREIPFSRGPTFTRAFESIAVSEMPVLVHCAAGKDRTGVLIALIQSAIGLGWKSISREYLMTRDVRNYRTHGHYVRTALSSKFGRPMSVASTRAAMEVSSANLRETFREIHRRCGTLSLYLTEFLGLHPSMLAALKERLCVPSVTQSGGK